MPSSPGRTIRNTSSGELAAPPDSASGHGVPALPDDVVRFGYHPTERTVRMSVIHAVLIAAAIIGYCAVLFGLLWVAVEYHPWMGAVALTIWFTAGTAALILVMSARIDDAPGPCVKTEIICSKGCYSYCSEYGTWVPSPSPSDLR